MDIIFMNSENSKRSDPDRLLLNLSDKKVEKGGINMFFIQSKDLLYKEKYKQVVQKQ